MATAVNFLSQYSLQHPARILICAWLFWPGTMFVVAYLGEHRKVHIGKGQSRTFFPGDFTLGFDVVILLKLSANMHIEYANGYLVKMAAVAAVFAIIARKIDIQQYSDPRSTTSPTKIAHDVCGFFIFAWAIGSLGFRVISKAIEEKSFMQYPALWGMLAFSIAFFASMIVVDIIRRPNPDLMHPADWRER